MAYSSTVSYIPCNQAASLAGILNNCLYDISDNLVPGSHSLFRHRGGLGKSKVNIPMSEWLKTYGVDQDFGLRRNRRIVFRAFKKMTTIKYMKFISKYGIVYLEQYPVPSPYIDKDDTFMNSILHEEGKITQPLNA